MILTTTCWAVVAGCQRPTPTAAPTGTPFPLRRPRPPVAGKTVVVDAGHGGRDMGAPGVGQLPEKRVNLAIALHVAELLRRRGVTVITTRRDDTYVSLDERATAADRSSADLLVSIHADSAANSRARGATVYIAADALEASQCAAARIDAALAAAGIQRRGIRPAGFRVLVGHSRPSVLVECGYLTNVVEAWQLASAEYQARVAGAIAAGVADYLASCGS